MDNGFGNVDGDVNPSGSSGVGLEDDLETMGQLSISQDDLIQFFPISLPRPRIEKPKLREIPGPQGFEAFAEAKKIISLEPLRKSFELRRSTNSTSILLLGNSGAGKSQTINSFFGLKDICPVDDRESCTKDIVKCTIKMPCEDLRIKNAELHVYDTPGFGDVHGGLEFDAKVLANIRDYFASEKYFPNYIFLAVNITDTRLGGPYSNFAKFLHAIKMILSGSALDLNNPNIIIIATHLCGLPPVEQNDPSPKLATIRSIAMEHLGLVDVPVIAVENLCEQYKLHKISKDGYFQLPNGEIFPRNIYHAMKHLSKEIDPVGFGIVNEAYYRLRKNKSKPTQTKIPIKDVRDVPVLTQKLQELFTPSESGQLQNVLETHSVVMNESLQFREHINVKDICRRLHQMECGDLQKLPQTVRDKMEFFRKLSPNSQTQQFIRGALNLEPPTFYVDHILGQSYDILQDKLLPSNKTKENESYILHRDLGCFLPNNVKASYKPNDRLIFCVAESEKDFITQRLECLGLKFVNDKDSSVEFKYNVKPGFNLMQKNSGRGDVSVPIYATHVYEIIALEMLNPHLNRKSRYMFLQLPNTYNGDDSENVGHWKAYIQKWGSHFVSKVNLGGCVDFIIQDIKRLKSQVKPNISDDDFLQIFFENKRQDSGNCILEVHGGSSRLRESLVGSTTRSEFRRRLTEWRHSLWEDPVISEVSLQLTSSSKLLAGTNPGSIVMENAIREILNVEQVSEAQPLTSEQLSRENDRKANSIRLTTAGYVGLSVLAVGGAIACAGALGAVGLLALPVLTLGALVVEGSAIAFAAGACASIAGIITTFVGMTKSKEKP